MKLSSDYLFNATMVPNEFIDFYMPAANGSYVKVYLYLLRSLLSGIPDVTISLLADRLDDSEKDVTRAIQYWEKVGLLTLQRNESSVIEEISLIAPRGDRNITEEIASEEEKEPIPLAVSVLPQIQKPVYLEKPVYTPAQIESLTGTEQVQWLMHVIEQYLERLLKPTDIQLILFLYESLGFSPELIIHLYEYCVLKNKKNPSYIEAVAIAWAEAGITTVEQAEIDTNSYNSNYNAVNKAFGLNRSPGKIEQKYIQHWLDDFHFSIDIIVEACNRTILNTQKPDFKYTDKILENWFKKQVTCMAHITLLDKEYEKTSKTKAAVKEQMPQKPLVNRFNNFPQRNYSEQEYISMEERLLRKS